MQIRSVIQIFLWILKQLLRFLPKKRKKFLGKSENAATVKPRPVEAGEYRVGDLNSNSFGYEKQPRPKEVGDFFPIIKYKLVRLNINLM